MEKSFELPKHLEADHAELERMDGLIYDMTEELKTKARAFWHEIEKTYNIRGKKLKFNDETRRIDLLPDEEPMRLPPGAIPGRLNGKGQVVPIKIDREDMGTALPSVKPQEKGMIRRAVEAIIPPKES